MLNLESMENIIREFPDKNTRLKYSFVIALILEIIFLLLIAEVSMILKNYLKPVERVKPMLISIINVHKKKKATIHHKKKAVPVKIKKILYKKPVIKRVKKVLKAINPVKFNRIPVSVPLAASVSPVIQHPAVYQDSKSVSVSLLDKYFGEIKAKIESNLIYPRYARRQGMEGNVKVLFKILRDGDLVFEKIDKSSIYNVLNSSAIKTIRISAPFMPFPRGINRDSMTFLIKIHFKLNRR